MVIQNAMPFSKELIERYNIFMVIKLHTINKMYFTEN